MSLMLRLAVVIMVLFPAAIVYAQGGPPLLTDDPGTPGNGNIELNLALTLDQTRTERVFELPLLDFNYGLGDHIQLKYELAYLVIDQEDAGPVGGVSNSLFGLKWRFLDEDRHGLAMSTYPQIEVNNPKSLRREFIESGTNLLLPIEAAKSFGKWEVGAEIGYQFIQHGDDQWIYGIAVGYPLTKQLELLAEIHGTADQDFSRHDPLFNLGTRYEF